MTGSGELDSLIGQLGEQCRLMATDEELDLATRIAVKEHLSPYFRVIEAPSLPARLPAPSLRYHTFIR
jgi:hypothetical protein